MKITYIKDKASKGYTVFYKDHPDIITQGATKREARKNLSDFFDYCQALNEAKSRR